MAVHTLQFHGAVVHVEISAGQSEFVVFGFRIADFNRTHTEVGALAVHRPTLLVEERCHQHVTIRLLGTPQASLRDGDLGMLLVGLFHGHCGFRLVGVETHRIDFVFEIVRLN